MTTYADQRILALKSALHLPSPMSAGRYYFSPEIAGQLRAPGYGRGRADRVVRWGGGLVICVQLRRFTRPSGLPRLRARAIDKAQMSDGGSLMAGYLAT